MRRFRLDSLGVTALAGFGLIVAPPVIWLLGAGARAAWSASHGPRIEPHAVLLLTKSLVLALGATGGAVLLGVPYGVALARAELPGRGALRVAALLALAMPPTALAIGWSLLLAPGARPLPPAPAVGSVARSWEGLPGVLIVLIAMFWPVIALVAARAAARTPREWEEAARLETTPWRAFAVAAGPSLRTAVGSGALLVFLLALAEYAVPGTMGVALYPVEILSRFQAARDEGEVAALAVPLLALILPILALQERWMRAAPALEGDRRAPDRLGLGPARPLLAALLWAIPVLGVGLPLFAMVRESLPPRTYGEVLAESAGAIRVSGLASGGAVGIAVPLALLLALWGAGGAPGIPAPGARWIERLALLPYALPGALVGVAWIALLNRPGPLGDLYASLAVVLPLCYASQFFPFAYFPLAVAVRRVDSAILEAARLDGASSWAILRAIVAPLARGSLLVAATLVALLSLRELDATSLLRPPDGDTLGFQIHDLYHYGPSRQVAALAVTAAACVAGLAASAEWLVRRLERDPDSVGKR